MKNFINKHKELLLEICRFLLVGGLATIIDYLFYLLSFYLIFKALNEQLNIVLSTAVGFIFGNIFNYIFSIIFVYKGAKENKTTQTFKAFMTFTIIGVIGLLIKIGCQLGGNYLVDLIFKDTNGFLAWFLNTVVYCFATLIVLVWNYVIRKLTIFKEKKGDSEL